MSAPRATTATALTTASLLAIASLLTGCGGGGSQSGGGSASSVSDTAGGSAEPAAPQASGSGKLAPGAANRSADGGSGTANSARVVPINRAVVYHGTITVRVRNVEAAVGRAEGFATGVDGLVFAEQTSSEPGRKGSSGATMTLKVPPTQFRPVLNEIGALGKPLSRSQTADDVTSQAVDIASRLRSQQASVARLRALLDRATTVGAIVQVEGELSQRESDLEALEAQQKRLSELVDLATIEVTFLTPDVKVAATVKKDHLGFLTGLGGGWNALVAALLVGLTVAGAVLPFLLLVALLGIPAWLVVRSRRHPAPLPAPATGSDG